jgi:hypothetical protein
MLQNVYHDLYIMTPSMDQIKKYPIAFFNLHRGLFYVLKYIINDNHHQTQLNYCNSYC